VKLIRELWYIFSPRERVKSLALLCAMALGAAFEAAGVGLLVPFIAVVKEPGVVFEFPAARSLLSWLNIREPNDVVMAIGLGLVIVFVTKSAYLVLLYRWQFRYIFTQQTRLGRRLVMGYLNAPYTFHLQRNSAELIKATTETLQRFTSIFVTSLLNLLGELLVVTALIVLLIVIAPLATLGAVALLGVPTALLYGAMRHRLGSAGRLTEQSFTSIIQWTGQALSGIKETLVTGRASFFIERHGYHMSRLADCMRSLMFLSTIPRLVIDTLAVTTMVGVALLLLARGQDLQSIFPVLGLFAAAAIRLMPSASRIANGLATLRFHYAAMEVIYQALVDTEEYVTGPSGREPDRQPIFPFDRSLVLEHLSYRYPGMPESAIDDVSLEIPRGHWVGLVGPTGAGKTTLIDLILGLYLPTSGRILVDGRDMKDNVAAWQHNLGYVPQHVYLMDDTVRRNIAFGLGDDDIDDERVWQALRGAQIDDFVRLLPGCLDAMIGERGDRLSGGERQRLGIARALYRDAAVLVVDEGTANLDNETEAAIVRTLAGLKGEKTIIAISHRLAFVSDCDQIYLLKQGKLRNSGTMLDLVSADSAFREFIGSAA
jgi:ABC-type multidrug transport system fused ATPase/permease subunit